MIFNWQGRGYDTARMSVFETGNPASPVVYVGAGEVFIVEVERLEGVGVRLASNDEAAVLAERLGFVDLLGGQKPPAVGNGERRHTLIVEDDGSTRFALSRLLHCSGYETDCAATVAEAEAKLNHNPGWLILDLGLPDGKGTALLARIRAQHLPIKVAVTTGETDCEVLSQVSELRPDAIFRKPVELSDVMRWLAAA